MVYLGAQFIIIQLEKKYNSKQDRYNRSIDCRQEEFILDGVFTGYGPMSKKITCGYTLPLNSKAALPDNIGCTEFITLSTELIKKLSKTHPAC